MRRTSDTERNLQPRDYREPCINRRLEMSPFKYENCLEEDILPGQHESDRMPQARRMMMTPDRHNEE